MRTKASLRMTPTPLNATLMPQVRQEGPPFAALALSLTSEPWPDLGLDLDIFNAPPDSMTPVSSDTDDIGPLAERITSLLLLRIVALVSHRDSEGGVADAAEVVDFPSPKPANPIRHYSDLSTSTIARTHLDLGSTSWPDAVSGKVVAQLRDFVLRILSKYRAVHYHNVEHCYHVTLSANKLLDLILNEGPSNVLDRTGYMDQAECLEESASVNIDKRKCPTYGLRYDPLSHLAFVFSALIHDVDHTGVTNRQLVDEADDLALLYNDQSVAEQRSLAVAFSTLRQPDFEALRSLLFPTRVEYQRFREVVINLVLVTDIASPERTQVVKSKWKEAFGGHPSSSADGVHRKKIRGQAPKQIATSIPGKGLVPLKENDVESETRNPPSSQSDNLVPIVDAIPNELNPIEQAKQYLTEPPHHHADTGSLPYNASPMPTTLKSSFFRSRTSMGLGYRANHETTRNHDIQSLRDSFPKYVNGRIEATFQGDEEGDAVESSKSIDYQSDSSPSSTIDERSDEEEDSMDGVIITDITLSKPDVENCDMMAQLSAPSHDHLPRSSITQGSRLIFTRRRQQRRFSLPSMTDVQKFERRLGIRRAVDLSGNMIESFSRKSDCSSKKESVPNGDRSLVHDFDEPDELKASAVLEQLMKAADVAAIMQGWDNKIKWSSKLFREQKTNSSLGRGVCPEASWYGGQIAFIDVYVMPLATRLAQSGIFDEGIGEIFASCTQDNRSRWLIEGKDMTQALISEFK